MGPLLAPLRRSRSRDVRGRPVAATVSGPMRKIERLVRERNVRERQVPLPPPDLKLAVTGTEYGHRREDGVIVVPIGCLAP